VAQLKTAAEAEGFTCFRGNCARLCQTEMIGVCLLQ